MPMIVIGRPFTVSARPITAESPASSRCQYAWLMTAPPSFASAMSSVPEKKRPSSGRTPRTVK